MRALQPRRQRGAIFVEAIVVVSVFVICFMGVIYFRTLFVEKLRVQRVARAAALSHAMAACKGAPTGTPELKGAVPRAGGNAKVSDSLRGTTARADSILDVFGQSNPLNPTTEVGLMTNVSTSTTDDGRTSGFSATVASTSYVSCADEVTNEQFGAIVDKVTSSLK